MKKAIPVIVITLALATTATLVIAQPSLKTEQPIIVNETKPTIEPIIERIEKDSKELPIKASSKVIVDEPSVVEPPLTPDELFLLGYPYMKEVIINDNPSYNIVILPVYSFITRYQSKNPSAFTSETYKQVIDECLEQVYRINPQELSQKDSCSL